MRSVDRSDYWPELTRGAVQSGEQVRGHAKQFLGAAMKVGLGEEGHGPAMYTMIDTTLKEDGPKIPRAKRSVGTKDALSQVMSTLFAADCDFAA